MGKFLVSLQRLDDWFQKQKRSLPWRNDPSVYRVWISEIMLQQTQVATVIPYFEKFIHRFPSVEELAGSEEEDVMRYWAGLGYYSRARNLRKGAQKIVEMGRFPQNRSEWLEIPGVGDYTAGAILSISLNQPEAILDGNVERVLSRVRRVNRQQGDAAFKERLWKVSRIFVEVGSRNRIFPSNLNQALMELGATLCTPRNPKCLLCPLQELCQARVMGDAESFPPRKKPKEWLQVQEKAHCVVDTSGKVLLRKRGSSEWRAGLWDLPEARHGSDWPEAKLVGEVETRHVVTRHKIKRLTQVWKVGSKTSTFLKAAEAQVEEGEWKWVAPAEESVPMGSALKRTLKAVSERFPGVWD